MSPTTTFNIREAAQLIGVSDDTLRRNIDRGALRASRDGGHLSVNGRDLVAFQQARQAAAETEGTPTSARNRLTGLVMAVKKDKVMAEVQLRCGPFVVTSLMSAESADRLGLTPGTLATAVVKATTVIVETPEGLS